MKKGKFWEKAKKMVWQGSGSLLMVAAVFFAAAPCMGHLYEPQVPEALQK